MLNAFVSSDVSKKNLDSCLLLPGSKPKYRTFANNAKGFEAFRAWAYEHTAGMDVQFCMEATGCYHLGLATFLAGQGDFVSVENPRRIKHFAIAANLKNKNDKLDSYCIARYAQTMNPRQWVLKDSARRELDAMRTRLRQLSADIRREESRLENEFLPELVKSQILDHVSFLESKIRQVEERVRQVMVQSDDARKVYNAVTLLKGAGPETALLMASLDIHHFDSAKAIPVFFGMNPRHNQSGENAGKTTISKAGDAVGRTLLISAANSAQRYNEVFKDFYDRLRLRGLKHKQAIVAVARKLLMVAWGIAKAALEGKPITYPGGPMQSRNAKKYCATT